MKLNPRNILIVSTLCIFFSSLRSDSLVVGYYPYWNYAVLPAESIKYSMLSHIIHAFVWPESDGSLHIDKNILQTDLIERAHNENVKVLISIGGAGHNDYFSDITSDSVICGQFIQHIIDFCNDRDYDGVDIDWEPLNSAVVRDQLNTLITALKDSISSQAADLLLTVAVPPTDWFGQWCDFETLKNYVDWFNIMTYDFFWSTATRANHNSPLYSPVQSQYDYGSIHTSLDYIHSVRGVPVDKIVLGIPFYGHACKAAGLFELNTEYIGLYDYNQIIPLIGNGWHYYWDEVSGVPYLLNDNHTEFITFDDTASVRLKCEYTRENNLAGVMIWDISKDVVEDHQPLLETINRTTGSVTNVFASPKPEYREYIKLKNFPDPFNDLTIISYFLSCSDRIIIEVFSAGGRYIETLVDEKKEKGWHQTVLNAHSYASGLYIYRLTTSQDWISEKMIIIK